MEIFAFVKEPTSIFEPRFLMTFIIDGLYPRYSIYKECFASGEYWQNGGTEDIGLVTPIPGPNFIMLRPRREGCKFADNIFRGILW